MRYRWQDRVGRLRAAAVAAALLTGFAPATGGAIGADLAGKGEWQSLSSAAKGSWSVRLLRSGDEVKGTFDLDGSNVISGGTVTGALTPDGITLGVVADGDVRASFAGKLEGEAIAGEWSLQSPHFRDEGVWSGVLPVESD